MLNYKKIFLNTPFSIDQNIKNDWFFKHQKKLSKFHYKNCNEFKKISNQVFKKINKIKNLEDLPFVAVEVFKKYNLKSTSQNNLSKILRSSGTTNNGVSMINLDRKTSLLQSRALSIIFSDISKNNDLEIFFVESPNVIFSKETLSARSAAISGFKQLAKKSYFLLDNKFNLNLKILTNQIKKNPKKEFIIFGFTSLIWLHLIKILKKKKIKLKKNNGILIHGGGWKKMQDQSVDRNIFNSTITEFLGIKKIHNYYGMVEQTGSIFLECEFGFFHASIFSEILIRNKNMQVCKIKENGLIQTFSLLPLSYPGHNILTEDMGRLEGEDGCKCGRKGRYFSIKGRVPGTTIRGCSDAY